MVTNRRFPPLRRGENNNTPRLPAGIALNPDPKVCKSIGVGVGRGNSPLDWIIMSDSSRLLLSGDEAVAHAARAAHVALGSGYPGTPSTEILEVFHELGGLAEWAPNEKVAFEVAIGAAFGGANALVTMKHVGLNVAADPLFTVAYTGVSGGLVVVTADDPGMSSSQNEQDNRRYAVAAGVPMFEPADSQ
jgi:indolepyruvate ferredoxin oxidoreductase, alpha subunit